MLLILNVDFFYTAGMMWLTFLVVLATGAYGEDCSDERIKQVADECKLQLREQFTDNFTVDCTGGVVQDYITCLTEISDCTNVMGITEVTLSEVYSFNSKMLSGITGPPDPNSPINSGSRIRKDCSLKCGWFYCRLTCGRFHLEIGVTFQRREAESNQAGEDFMCTLGTLCVACVAHYAKNSL